MKKTLIAGAAATVAMAAMPMAGVFAVNSVVTDYVQLNINESCTMTATEISTQANRIVLGTINAGAATSGVEGTPMTISCNTDAGISLTAEASTLTSGSKPAIEFGAFAAGTSVWSAQVAVTGADAGNVTISNGWDAYDSAKTAGTILTSSANTAVSNIVVTPSYKASAAANQPAGTYNGQIVYTFVATE